VTLASFFGASSSIETWLTVGAAVAGLVGSIVAALIARPRATAAAPTAPWLPARPYTTVDDRLRELSESMQRSAELVDQVSSELAARAATARELKEEAENAEAFAALHKEQTDAVRKLLEADRAAAAQQQADDIRRTMEAELEAQARRIRSDSIKIGIASFVAGGGLTLLVTLLVHPLR
jgi:hypothetical protein